MARRVIKGCGFVFFGLALVWGCAFDDTLREYLNTHFWLPFSKKPWHFERTNVRRISAPYAGMAEAEGEGPLAKLRAAYQQVSQPETVPFDVATLRQAVAAARADKTLTRRQRGRSRLDRCEDRHAFRAA